jgi:hypothetical protein
MVWWRAGPPRSCMVDRWVGGGGLPETGREEVAVARRIQIRDDDVRTCGR